MLLPVLSASFVLVLGDLRLASFSTGETEKTEFAELNHSLRGFVRSDVAYSVIYVIVRTGACVNG